MWLIEHLGGLVLLLPLPFQQFSLCPCQALEVVAFLLLRLLMMEFLLRDLLLRQHLRTFSFTGGLGTFLYNLSVIKGLLLMNG